ncbi:hypothetical protein BJF78_31540 [Pseudonocardia sp. CNS-139]|nr:hypothetical protein BJF78_31540 [Pseudonocardia sp. CNS-139]
MGSAQPYPLAEITVRAAGPGPDPEAGRRRAAAVLAGPRHARYSAVLRTAGGMTSLFDGRIYRPLRIETVAGRLAITVTDGSYFDFLDTSDVLGLETELGRRGDRPGREPYRRFLRDPFDLANRVASLGIGVLTVRAAGERCTFFLHHRDPRHVAGSADLVAVVPAGEFAPSDISAEAVDNDRDLWRTVMREYAEEFLGAEDAQGRGARWIDYDGEPPYRDLQDGLATGAVRVSVLGLGLEPLTWKPQLLTVCRIEAPLFDAVFGAMVRRNEEGTLLVGRGRGLPFDERTVTRYVSSPATAPSTRDTLRLAWRHRHHLGIGPPRADPEPLNVA